MTRCFDETYDISVGLGEGDAAYPGDVPYSKEVTSIISAGANYNLSTLRLSAHSGTHIDAPAHYIDGAKTLDMYPPERFILAANVIFTEDNESIKPDVLRHADVKECDAVLFKTQNSISGLCKSGIFSEKFVYLSEEAAKLCIDLDISLVGIDYISIDRYEDDAAPVHHMLLKNDVLILEGIDLSRVAPGKYMLAALPLRIKDVEAAPARAILLR
ncbi:MAG: cyclase family protein [Methanotrichaceae archaeon]